MPNILLITNQVEKIQSGGRELLSKLNHDALKEIYNSHFFLIELVKDKRSLKSILNSFRGHIDGINKNSIELILSLIQSKNIKLIFIDGSNLGGIIKIVKQRFPKVRVCTFFHNVEAKFFLGSLLENRSVHALVVLIINYLAERKAVKYSNSIICLSNRDSNLLFKLYGRPATHISPMALHDKFSDSPTKANQALKGRYVLFVGGGFYANRAGITWYCEHVAPHLNIKTIIVGRGLEDLKVSFANHLNVEVIGAVDNLNDWYRDAHIVVAPIFDGSGMKTKVAEALMYGKKIVGTPEAFSGYEEIIPRAGWLCRSAVDFISAIEEADLLIYSSFNKDLRSIYETIYSFPAAKSRISNIVNATFHL